MFVGLAIGNWYIAVILYVNFDGTYVLLVGVVALLTCLQRANQKPKLSLERLPTKVMPVVDLGNKVSVV
jgi:hypothetical protein